VNINGQPSLLRIETTKERDNIEIPDFIDVVREVTQDQNYQGAKMAELEHKMPQ